MDDMDLMRMYEAARNLPELVPVGRFEVGEAVLEWLRDTARPEGAPSENPWRPVGWTPPPPIAVLFGVPVVLNEGLEPHTWRAIDRDGNVMEEGTLWNP